MSDVKTEVSTCVGTVALVSVHQIDAQTSVSARIRLTLISVDLTMHSCSTRTQQHLNLISLMHFEGQILKWEDSSVQTSETRQAFADKLACRSLVVALARAVVLARVEFFARRVT